MSMPGNSRSITPTPIGCKIPAAFEDLGIADYFGGERARPGRMGRSRPRLDTGRRLVDPSGADRPNESDRSFSPRLGRRPGRAAAERLA